MYQCPRCKREAVGWPLARPDICSPDGNVTCWRNPRPEWRVPEWRLRAEAKDLTEVSR